MPDRHSGRAQEMHGADCCITYRAVDLYRGAWLLLACWIHKRRDLIRSRRWLGRACQGAQERGLGARGQMGSVSACRPGSQQHSLRSTVDAAIWIRDRPEIHHISPHVAISDSLRPPASRLPCLLGIAAVAMQVLHGCRQEILPLPSLIQQQDVPPSCRSMHR